MSPVLACACAALLTLACGNVLALDPLAPWAIQSGIAGQPAPARVQNCTVLMIGIRSEDATKVAKYTDEMYIWKDKELTLPKVPVFGELKGAKITACNPTGRAPFLFANDGNNISGQVHCSFMEKPLRCPLGLNIQIEEYYLQPPQAGSAAS